MEFTKTHEWVDIENGIATFGISAFAQKELGDIVYVELPKIGASFKQGDPIVILESTKAAIDIYSPISGVITAVNLALKEAPELVNTSPENAGWLVKLKVDPSNS